MRWLDREIELMPTVADAVDVTVPRFEKLGRPSDAFPSPFVGYRWIAGVTVPEAPVVDGGLLARNIAHFLTQLHAIDPRTIRPTPDDWERFTMHDWHKMPPDDAERVAAVLPPDVAERVSGHLGHTVAPPPFTGEKRSVHNDLGIDHLLVAPETGRLAGVIDFTETLVADPAVDFSGLVTIGDWTFVRDVVRGYDLPTDETFMERVVWASRVLSLIWLRDLLDEGDVDPSVVDRGHILWVIRAFEDPR